VEEDEDDGDGGCQKGDEDPGCRPVHDHYSDSASHQGASDQPCNGSHRGHRLMCIHRHGRGPEQSGGLAVR
jgi:hypothetical protein